MTQPLPNSSAVTFEVDLRHFPVTYIPHLTIVKWSLSSYWECPRAHDKKRSLDLTDYEAQALLYEQIKRSIGWRQNTGIELQWDDVNLRISALLDGARLNALARPVLAKIAEATLMLPRYPDIRRAAEEGLVRAPDDDGLSLVGDLLSQKPSRHSGPAFRVDFSQLDYSIDATIYHTDEQQLRQAGYNRLKATIQALPADSRAVLDDVNLAITFLDLQTVLNGSQSLTGQLLSLADRSHTYRMTPDRAELPGPGKLFPSRYLGVLHRKIEMAFGAGTYRDQRQFDRRSIGLGLDSDTICAVYSEYDARLSGDTLRQVSDAVASAVNNNDPKHAFRALFTRGGFVLGENHRSPDAPAFVAAYIEPLQQCGLTHIILEEFESRPHQRMIDTYLDTGVMPAELNAYITTRDAIRHEPVYRNLFHGARKYGVRIMAGDHITSFVAAGAGRFGDHSQSEFYDAQSRLVRYNLVSASIARKSLPAGAGILHIAGLLHVHPTEFGYPGLAQLQVLPALTVRRGSDGSYGMGLIKEPPDRRPDSQIGAVPMAPAALPVIHRKNLDASIPAAYHSRPPTAGPTVPTWPDPVDQALRGRGTHL